MATRIWSALRNSQFNSSVRQFNFTLFAIATWIPAVIFFNDHVGMTTSIRGPSMYPFLNSRHHESQTRDWVWISRWNPTSDLQRGMVVSFKSPANPENTAVKRIIALEGDLVVTRAPYPLPTVRVPVNHIWVEGDNRDSTKTLDSNTYGPIPVNLIEGKVTHVLLPWESFGPIKWQEFKGRTKVIKGRPEEAPGWD